MSRMLSASSEKAAYKVWWSSDLFIREPCTCTAKEKASNRCISLNTIALSSSDNRRSIVSSHKWGEGWGVHRTPLLAHTVQSLMKYGSRPSSISCLCQKRLSLWSRSSHHTRLVLSLFSTSFRSSNHFIRLHSLLSIPILLCLNLDWPKDPFTTNGY